MTKEMVELAAAKPPMSAIASVVLGMLLAAVGPERAWAQAPADPYYGAHMWGGGSWMFFGPLIMILLAAVVVVVAFIVVRWLVGPGPAATAGRPSDKAALDILKERFARGEIDQTEFEQRRRVLSE